MTIRLRVLDGNNAAAPPPGTMMGVGCDTSPTATYINWLEQNLAATCLQDTRTLECAAGSQIVPVHYGLGATAIADGSGSVTIEWLGELA